MRRSFGVLCRTYTANAEDVLGRVKRALVHARHLVEVSKQCGLLERVLFLVPSDYDSGTTNQMLDGRLQGENLLGRVVTISVSGHHSREVLNRGLDLLLRVGCTHALIVSGKAVEYVTSDLLTTFDQAFERGAKVAGAAIGELRDIVLSGRVQNTCAAWDIHALLGEGGFDSMTQVEEIAPSIRLARRYGPCIAVHDVPASALDVHQTAEARARHEEVLGNKIAFQRVECVRVSSNFAEIEAAVLR